MTALSEKAFLSAALSQEMFTVFAKVQSVSEAIAQADRQSRLHGERGEIHPEIEERAPASSIGNRNGLAKLRQTRK